MAVGCFLVPNTDSTVDLKFEVDRYDSTTTSLLCCAILHIIQLLVPRRRLTATKLNCQRRSLFNPCCNATPQSSSLISFDPFRINRSRNFTMRTPPSLSGRSRKAQSPQSSCGQQQTDMHSFFSTVVGVKRSRVPDTPPSEFSAAAIQSPPTPPWCRRTFEILTPPSNERNNQETSTTTFTDNRGVAIRINNSSSTVSFSNSTARDEIATTTKKASLQQLYLDLGQRDFAKQTICETCGMLFVHGLSEDAKEHKKMCHNFLHGVPFYAAKTARVVARSELGVVVEVS